MILAETNIAALSEMGPVTTIALILSLALNAVLFVKALRGDSEKREVTLSPEAVTRSEFEEARRSRDIEIEKILHSIEQLASVNRQEHEGIHKKIGGVERGAREDLRLANLRQDEGRKNIHDQLNVIIAGVAELKGRINERGV